MPPTDVLNGALELLVLRALRDGPLHGYAIARHIQSVSRDELRVEEGSLYPALHRMKQDGLLSASWGTTDTGRRARFYALTPAGRERLAAETERWTRVTRAIGLVLRHA